MPLLLTLIIFVIMIAWTSFRLSKERERAGIAGWIRDQDLDGNGRRYYFNSEIGIGCKPDIKENCKIIEYKSSSAGRNPYPADLMQLAGEMIATGAGTTVYINLLRTVQRRGRPFGKYSRSSAGCNLI